MKSTKE